MVVGAGLVVVVKGGFLKSCLGNITTFIYTGDPPIALAMCVT